jgi:hypothetical protein
MVNMLKLARNIPFCQMLPHYLYKYFLIEASDPLTQDGTGLRLVPE